MKITKAIIPAAGLGTRLLPYTKAVPKELIPVVNKPAIQMIVEEGINSGISAFTIIANQDKHAILDYFSDNSNLREQLKRIGKDDTLTELNSIIATASFSYVPQENPLGLGHAVLMAEHTIGNNYCAVMLPDEIMISKVPALSQLIEIAIKYNTSVIAVQEVPYDKVSSYGIVAIKNELEENVFEIERLVEKPTKDQAPSNLAIIGRYILSPAIFSALKNTRPGAGNEIQLTDGIIHLMHTEKVLAYKINTTRHDIGNPLGWLQANISCGISHPSFGPHLKEYLAHLLK